jgi:hypothetical protein
MYNFKPGDLILEHTTNTQHVGLVIDTWDDFVVEKLMEHNIVGSMEKNI